jgi:uncharacterized protein (DUF1684 family)
MERTLGTLAAWALLGVGIAAQAETATTASYDRDLAAWRAKAEASLRRDLGWLTIAGRWELRSGDQTIGSAPGNDIVLPRELAPAKLGKIRVEKDRVTLLLEPGIRMWVEPEPGTRGAEFSERALQTRGAAIEWVTSGRLSLYVFTRDDGKSVLRIADRESRNRAQFAGRLWYEPKPTMRVAARFNPYPAGTKIPVANVRGEITEEDAAGNVEFDLDGRTFKLDAFAEDDGALFIIVRDQTSGVTTYPPGRFLRAEKPVDGSTIVDFNKTYNPPCAFSAYTTCPLPPPQNWLKTKIDAGERYVQAKK